MQTTFAVFAFAALASVASAQSSLAAGALTPTASAPSGCSTNYASKFEITVVKVAGSSKRDLIQKRATTCATENILVAQLSKGILTDSKGRIGGIVANHQFQFDGPPSQAGTIYNGGWSVCNNGSLAIGNDAIWYQCLSGSFYNLYNEAVGSECQEVLIDVIPCTDASTGTTAAGVTQTTDGQIRASSAVTQISDGQVQASSAVTQISDGQLQASSAVLVSQISDGQIQATVSATALVSQISDGQIQATVTAKTTSAAAVTTKASTVKSTSSAALVSQISDGQIQASATSSASTKATSAASASTSKASVTSVVATSTTAASTTASTTRAVVTGAANALTFGSFGAAVVGAAAVALL